MQTCTGSLLAKINIKSAHQLIPVQWNGNLCVDCMLPFGLCSAPKIFNAVVDTLELCVLLSRLYLPLPQ